MLLLHGDGLSATELLTEGRPRVSQPTLWRALNSLRAQGALIREGLVDVLRVMTEHSEVADVLRKESPMSALVLVAERQQIFDSTRTG